MGNDTNDECNATNIEKKEFSNQEEEIASNEYSKEYKTNILSNLNERRLSVQKREEIKKKRTDKKHIYKFGSKSYYKFMNMEREYYIRIEDCEKVSSRPAIITLYYRTFYELQKKDVLLKTEIYSDKFFISHNAIRVYFKSYTLEEHRC